MMRRAVTVLLLALPLAVPAAVAQELPISARMAIDYRALRERPLFAPDRRAPQIVAPPIEEPVAEVVAAPPPPAAAPDWELVGLVRSERVNSALFRAPGGQSEFTLRKGETRDGWTLTDIGRFEVTLDSSHGRASVRFPGSR